jgi:hypothetical protein
VNAAELISACQAFEDENGIHELLILLNDIIIARAQACGLNIEYFDEDGEPLEDMAATIQ